MTVTLLDGIVVARSAFHHSLNYRSVVAYGKARAVDDPEEKLAALDAITEHILPGRTAEVFLCFSFLEFHTRKDSSSQTNVG